MNNPIFRSLCSSILLTFISSVCHGEIQDPMMGRHHLILDVELAYLARAPKLHNIGCLSQVEDTANDGINCAICDNCTDSDDTGDCIPGDCEFTTLDLIQNQGYQPGLRATANYLVDQKQLWQVRYLGLIEWSNTAEAFCPGNLEFPFSDGLNNTVDYQNASYMKGEYNTRFWSAEVNYWYMVTPRRVNWFSVSWVFGFRYLDIHDQFLLKSKGENPIRGSTYKITTKNRMGAVQLGGDFEGNLGANFTWGIAAKMGAAVNFAQNTTLFKDKNNTSIVKSYNPSDFNLAFLGEIGPFILFNLTKKIIFKASYEAIYLSNVAIALDQITFSESNVSDLSNKVNISEAFIAYGGYIGLGFDF